MGKYADIDALIDGMVSAVYKASDEILGVMDRETKKESERAYEEFGAYQTKAISELFHEAVQEFYDAYTPGYYQRQYGLNNVLDIHTDDKGMAVYDTVEDLLDPSGMHGDRSGGDLYEKVFVRGWHGGAESGPDHPAPGVPYYRKPDGLWFQWSRPAERSEAPIDIFRRTLSQAEGGEIYKNFARICNEHNEIAMEKVRDESAKIFSKYYG